MSYNQIKEDEICLLKLICRKYGLEMDSSSTGLFPTGPKYSHFETVRSALKGKTSAELIHEYVAMWANDFYFENKRLFRKIMEQNGLKYCSEAYLLYNDWLPKSYVKENPDSEENFMDHFCIEFGHLF
jgi:hypothetical protein